MDEERSSTPPVKRLCQDGVNGLVVLGLLLGAGHRLEKRVGLRFEDLAEMPQKNGKSAVL
jgi:hypothetical protein